MCRSEDSVFCFVFFNVANEIVGFGGLNLFLLSYVEDF